MLDEPPDVVLHADPRATLVAADDGAGVSDAVRAQALAPAEASRDAFIASAGGAQIGLSIICRLAEARGGGARFITAPGAGFRAEIDVSPALRRASARRVAVDA